MKGVSKTNWHTHSETYTGWNEMLSTICGSSCGHHNFMFVFVSPFPGYTCICFTMFMSFGFWNSVHTDGVKCLMKPKSRITCLRLTFLFLSASPFQRNYLNKHFPVIYYIRYHHLKMMIETGKDKCFWRFWNDYKINFPWVYCVYQFLYWKFWKLWFRDQVVQVIWGHPSWWMCFHNF